jgi:hypothetical protein
MDTTTVLLRVPRREIVLVQGILEGYEGWMATRTLCPSRGILELLVAPAFYGEVLALIAELAPSFGVDVVGPEALEGCDDIHPL